MVTASPPCPSGTPAGHKETVVTDSQQQGRPLGLNSPIGNVLRKEGWKEGTHSDIPSALS